MHRFSVFVIFALLFGCTFAVSAQTYSQAVAACQAQLSANQAVSPDQFWCVKDANFSRIDLLQMHNGGQVLDNTYGFTGSVTEDNSACSKSDDGDDAAVTSWLVGKILTGYSSCESQQDSVSGNWVQCGHSMQPSSPPYYDPQLGAWRTKVTASATHALCGSTTSSSPISQQWQSSSGQAVSTADAPPGPPTPYNTTNPPKVCGGGSCYDPNSDQYCATSNGQQVCVPGPTARSSGGCQSSGGGTLCSGSPASPSPPVSNVPDPATDIRSIDKTQQADVASGNPVQVTTTVYATGNTVTASGQNAGDSGPANGGQSTTGNAPAHASSAGGNGTYSGGTDCNTPPVCTGDAVLCGASRAQWATTCQVHTDLAGTLPAPSATSLATGGSYDQGSVWTTPSTGNTVGDQANAGNYDQSGFGYGTQCPFVDTHVTFMSSSFSLSWSEACDATSYLRWVVIGFALYLGACITAGSNR